ncbi:MAG: NAD(P)H-dependent oxidoreductase [Deltaproteobacteria bacterium]|nr:NAD(P)H-dependent oxidoreductase [Deltaproteobacteria bacterium]
MKISIILAHPNKQSFNHAIANTILEELKNKSTEISFHDLYEETFDPILPAEEIPKDVHLPENIERHCQEIGEADGIIIIHPNWWGQPPAILKGWVDRVLRPGIAYEFLEGDKGEGVPNGLLKARAALVLNTSNTEPNRERDLFGDPLETIWKNCIFGLCGVHAFYRKTFRMIVTSSKKEREMWLRETKDLVNEFIESIISVEAV